jgi:hypothetical protein
MSDRATTPPFSHLLADEAPLIRLMLAATPMLGRANAMIYGGAALGALLAWLVSP